MDLEETVRELKDDLKNAREMINCLNETVKSLAKIEKPGKDEELHKKLDELLQRRNDPTPEMMELKKELKSIGQEVELVKKHLNIILKGSQKQEEKFFDLAGNIEHLLNLQQDSNQKVGETGETTRSLDEKVEKIKGRVQSMDDKLWKITESEQNQDFILGKMDKLKYEIKCKIDFIARSLAEINEKNDRMEMALKCQILEFGEIKIDLEEKLTTIEKKVETEEEPTVYKCWYPFCKKILPKDLPLRKDGVTVTCPHEKCGCPNIIAKPKEGHKWMFMACDDFHYQQYPRSKKNLDIEVCFICGKNDKLYESNHAMAVPY